jgi:hypothetical protein
MRETDKHHMGYTEKHVCQIREKKITNIISESDI